MTKRTKFVLYVLYDLGSKLWKEKRKLKKIMSCIPTKVKKG